MHYSELSKALLTHPGVVRLEYLSDDVQEAVGEIEYSPNNVGFTPIDPAGLNEVCSMPLRLIMFCSAEFQMFDQTFIDIVDTRGELVGHDVLGQDRHLYESDDYIWLADNIVLDLTAMSDYPLRTVIHSFPFRVDGAEGVEMRLFYPSVMSAEYLNDRFGARGKIVATVLLGVNGVEF